MLIKRFIAIKQVGGFYNFGGGGALPFADPGHNLTVVFGRNTYGKSTLAEIMSSLGSDDPTMLDSRESIPPDAEISRLVELNYLTSDGTEQSAKLTSTWSANELTGNIDVFDEEFVHRNLITGNKILRENHEYFTDFILGEEGVELRVHA
jgi:hypothetical protein